MFGSKAKTQLLEALRREKERTDGFQNDLGAAKQTIVDLKVKVSDLEAQVISANLQRVSAQRGLVPYVRGLEQFAEWLKKEREVTPQMVATKMVELEIWDVKIAYDPDKDLGLSVLSPNRYGTLPPRDHT